MGQRKIWGHSAQRYVLGTMSINAYCIFECTVYNSTRRTRRTRMGHRTKGVKDVQVNDSSSLPYYEQLVLKVKQQIVRGILQPGDRLPSVRDMARQEQLNPNTVSKAYKQLETQQVIMTVHGKGTYVRESDQETDNTTQIIATKQRLKTLLTEIRYLGVPADEVIGWIKTAYEEAD